MMIATQLPKPPAVVIPAPASLGRDRGVLVAGDGALVFTVRLRDVSESAWGQAAGVFADAVTATESATVVLADSSTDPGTDPGTDSGNGAEDPNDLIWD